MKHSTKRLLCLFLSLLLVVPFLPLGASADESSDELSEETIERVYEEVLTGNITNTEDVLNVALAQWQATKELASESTSEPTSSIATCSTQSTEDDDAPLQITQYLGKSTDENGVTTDNIAVTGLLVLDGEGRSVSATEYEQYHMHNNDTKGSLNSYSIFATHTIYVRTYYYDETYKCSTIQLYKMSATLIYGSALKATKMRQVYADEADYYGLDTRIEEQSWISSPAAGTYVFTPSQSRRLPIGSTQVQGRVEVYYGESYVWVGTILPTDFLQDKIDNGTLEEGW